jgi:hypothetical protein
MSDLDIDLLEDTRRSICGNCEYYNKKKDACNFIVLKTGKLGLLSHAHGVRNPKARCPYFYERKWNFVPSYYAWELNRLVLPLSPEQVYEYTRAMYLSSLAILSRLRAKHEENPEVVLLPGNEVIRRVKQINAQPNEYQHVKYLHVEYDTGFVYE